MTSPTDPTTAKPLRIERLSPAGAAAVIEAFGLNPITDAEAAPKLAPKHLDDKAPITRRPQAEAYRRPGTIIALLFGAIFLVPGLQGIFAPAGIYQFMASLLFGAIGAVLVIMSLLSIRRNWRASKNRPATDDSLTLRELKSQGYTIPGKDNKKKDKKKAKVD